MKCKLPIQRSQQLRQLPTTTFLPNIFVRISESKTRPSWNRTTVHPSYNITGWSISTSHFEKFKMFWSDNDTRRTFRERLLKVFVESFYVPQGIKVLWSNSYISTAQKSNRVFVLSSMRKLLIYENSQIKLTSGFIYRNLVRHFTMSYETKKTSLY